MGIPISKKVRLNILDPLKLITIILAMRYTGHGPPKKQKMLSTPGNTGIPGTLLPDTPDYGTSVEPGTPIDQITYPTYGQGTRGMTFGRKSKP